MSPTRAVTSTSCVLAALLASTPCAAQDVPDWGVFVDVDSVGAASVAVRDGVSFLELASDPNLVNARAPVGNAPRVERPLAGDFSVQLHVRWFGAEGYPWPGPRMGLGPKVMLHSADDHYYQIALNYDPFDAAANRPPYTLWTRTVPRSGGEPWTRVDGPDLWFRLEREGSTVRSYFGYDGATWVRAGESEVNLPDEVTLLLVLPNGTSGTTRAHFGPLDFDAPSPTAQTTVADPHRVAQRAQERRAYLRVLGFGLGVVAVSLLLGGLIGRRRRRVFPAGESVLGAGQRWWAYAVSVVVALLVFTLIASLASAGAYMGSAFVTLGVVLVSLPIAGVSLIWIPLGAWYASALTAESDRRVPPAVVGFMGLGVAAAAGSVGGFFLGGEVGAGLLVGASVAAGGCAYMVSCWKSVRG